MATLRDTVTLSHFAGLLADAHADKLLSAEEVAEHLGVTVAEVRAWAAESIIPNERIGGQYIFKALGVIRWLLAEKRMELEIPASAEAKARQAQDDEKTRAEARRVYRNLGPEATRWFLEGNSYQECERLFDEKHSEELKRLSINLGSELRARACIAQRLRREFDKKYGGPPCKVTREGVAKAVRASHGR